MATANESVRPNPCIVPNFDTAFVRPDCRWTNDSLS